MALGKSIFEEQINNLKSFIEINIKNKGPESSVVFATLVVKKTIEILYTASYAYSNKLYDVLFSLIRMLQDNCLAIEAASELGFKSYMTYIGNNEPINTKTIPPKFRDNNPLNPDNLMTDGHLRDMVDKKYKGFGYLYKTTSRSIHFNGQSFNLIMRKKENGNKELYFEVGNKGQEYKEKFSWASDTIVKLSKIIFDMLHNAQELDLLTK